MSSAATVATAGAAIGPATGSTAAAADAATSYDSTSDNSAGAGDDTTAASAVAVAAAVPDSSTAYEPATAATNTATATATNGTRSAAANSAASTIRNESGSVGAILSTNYGDTAASTWTIAIATGTVAGTIGATSGSAKWPDMRYAAGATTDGLADAAAAHTATSRYDTAERRVGRTSNAAVASATDAKFGPPNAKPKRPGLLSASKRSTNTHGQSDRNGIADSSVCRSCAKFANDASGTMLCFRNYTPSYIYRLRFPFGTRNDASVVLFLLFLAC